MKSLNVLVVVFLLTATATAQTVSTVAGMYSGEGQTGLNISINPRNQVVDPAGNIYFVEPERNLVRKLSATGVYSTIAGTSIAGYSGDGGPATTARLNFPYGIALDSTGNIYIADNNNHCIRKVTSTGIISTVAGNGTAGYSGDGGPATAATLLFPVSVAVDRAGNMYIVDIALRLIRKVNTAGIISTFAGTIIPGNFQDGVLATASSLDLPLSVTTNAAGEVFIADVTRNNIRKVNGSGYISTIAGSASGNSGFSGDGYSSSGSLLNGPICVVSDGANNIYITDTYNNRIRKINAANGVINTVAGNGGGGYSGDGAAATAAQLYTPQNITVSRSGEIYTTAGYRIRKIATGNIISTIAGNGEVGYNGNHIAVTSAQIYQPQGIAIDRQQNIYFSESVSSRLKKINPAGIISVVAGTGMGGYSGDGGPATAAQLGEPYGLAIDSSGNIYIADFSNNRIRKIDINGIITTVAGNGTSGYSGDGGPATAAQLSGVTAVAVDKNGNLFIVDRNNNYIRKIAPNGIITTIAGNGTMGFSGDGGPATAAALNFPNNLAIDSSGNVLFIDERNYRVRKINLTTNVISTVAGNGQDSDNGDGGLATAAGMYPTAISTDALGNIYIATNNNRIRKVSPAGIITPLAGGGTTYTDTPVAATSAEIQRSSGLAVDSQQNLFFVDYYNNRIRKVTAPGCRTWTGAVSTNWENTGNWTCGLLPDSTTDVVIHSGIIRINSNVMVHSLHLDPGVTLTVSTGYTLTVLQ